jgi:hypothetical protein
MGFNRIILDYNKLKTCFEFGGVEQIKNTLSKYDSISVDMDETVKILDLINNENVCPTKKTLLLNNIFYGK